MHFLALWIHLKRMTMPELLSPAGDISIFKSVIEMGADAVYFAGSLFGARAYAKNFSDEEVIEAIDYAHIYDKKAYLTVNTLLKNQEVEKYLYDYIKKFYEAGIDAILVQDIGVFFFIKKYFPALPLHISTQASVSSHYGAIFFKKLGAERVVLSRELSIAEIKNIKETTGIDIEVFVHGAMCVSYSGKCLMSSMIGGRSGNRGRCAQPCRLNYETKIDGKIINPLDALAKGSVKNENANVKSFIKQGSKSKYEGREYFPLSMKDLCGISEIPALIDANVDSLKIEGRMKSKEYASGVTSAYRNFIDAYAENPDVINDKKYMKEISDYLLALGNRGNFSHAYFYQRSSKDLISFKDSSLHTGDILKTFRDSAPRKNKINVIFKASLSDGIFLSMILDRNKNCSSEYSSDKVFSAEKRAVTKEEIIEKLSEISDTPFEIESIDIDIEDGIFIPMSEIKSLKRSAIASLTAQILTERKIEKRENIKVREEIEEGENLKPREDIELYFYSCLFESQFTTLLKNDNVQNIIIPASLFLRSDKNLFANSGKNIFIALPSVIRDEDRKNLKCIIHETAKPFINGFFASSYDGITFLDEAGIDKNKIFLSPEIYIFNNYSVKALKALGYKNLSIPYELNENELRHMNINSFMMTIYGKTPVMHLEDCIYRNTYGCHVNEFMKDDYNKGYAYYVDRLGKEFFDSEDCAFCQNTLYNSYPTSLLSEMKKIRGFGIKDFLIDFTDEDENEMNKVLSLVFLISSGKEYNDMDTRIKDTTRGHFYRGVE